MAGIISTSDPVGTTPHLRVILLSLTKQNLSAKDVIGDKKKMRRTQEIS